MELQGVTLVAVNQRYQGLQETVNSVAEHDKSCVTIDGVKGGIDLAYTQMTSAVNPDLGTYGTKKTEFAQQIKQVQALYRAALAAKIKLEQAVDFFSDNSVAPHAAADEDVSKIKQAAKKHLQTISAAIQQLDATCSRMKTRLDGTYRSFTYFETALETNKGKALWLYQTASCYFSPTIAAEEKEALT